MSRKNSNRYIIAAAIFAGIFLISMIALRWHTKYAKTEILDYTSDDGVHELIIYMIGEPDWPFGNTHCRFDLFEDGKRIIKYSFAILDDGANASADNFTVIQGSNTITVAVYGSEQGMTTYILNYNGTVEVR